MTRVLEGSSRSKNYALGFSPSDDGSFFQTVPPPNDAGKPHALRSWRWNSAKEPPDSRVIRLTACASAFFLLPIPASGGVKGGVHYGETDEIRHKAAVSKVSVNDLHATILALLGLDHEKLTYRFNGRNFP